MFNIKTGAGDTFLCQTYISTGNGLVLDGNRVISGPDSYFTITDLNAPVGPGPADWLIDIGPFFDRFGASKMAVLTSSDVVVKAIVEDLKVRKWVDLRRTDVSQGIDLLILKGIQGVNADLKAFILETPVLPVENLAVRKLYFNT